MLTKSIFLASSSELKEDRQEFEIFIARKNKAWVDQGVFLKLILWEDFLDVMSQTRLQDEYNQAIGECDLFVMLFFTKVGPYTEEEFETAFGQFKATHKPFIFTYFKDAPIHTGSINEDDVMSLLAFKKKLKALGHFATAYKNIDALKSHFNQQLDKLAASGFIEFKPEPSEKTVPGGVMAHGPEAKAVGPRGVIVGGDNTDNINTGTQTRINIGTQTYIDTGGGAHVRGNVNTGGGNFIGHNQIGSQGSAKKAQADGGSVIAQGKRARAASQRGVVASTVSGPIVTGDTTYQTIIHQATQSGARAGDLRRAYLAWLSTQANDLPLFTSDSGAPVQLSSVYTALLTQGHDASEAYPHTAGERLLARADRDTARQSALEALDQEQYLVLMGGPGSGKTTFLNFVTLCMAGEVLSHATTHLKLLCTPIPPEPDDNANKEPRPQRWTHPALLPVRVVLRDFAANLPTADHPASADDLWNHIVKQLPDQLQRYADDLQAELLGQGGLILLDGLDEVPDVLQRREQVKQAVQGFASIYRGCRFLVTSRTYAYQRQDWKLDGFAERELLRFTRGQIERFIDAWYAHMAQDLFRLTNEDAQARAKVLKYATQRTELRELAERPLLLTLMVRLQTKGGGSLPENREELYAQSVEMLLDEWEGLKLRRTASGQPIVIEPSLSEWLNASRENIRRELDKLAYTAHLNQPSLVGTADIHQSDLIAALMAASTDQPDTKFVRLEEYLRDRAGLLASHGEKLYQFPHRSFQEYLAACHLGRVDFPDTLSRRVKTDPNRWREVTLLAAIRSKDTPSAIWELVEELCTQQEAPAEDAPEPNNEAQWGALLAAQVLRETGLSTYDPALQQRHENKRQRVRNWQVRLLRSSMLPARERALAGDLLARLGDPRSHLLDVEHLRFAAVPRGPFWMGEQGDENAELHCNTALDYDYWIAQAPVTVAQFRQFVISSGYQKHDAGRLLDLENRSVRVSWYDAQAFCAWLSHFWRERLPEGWRVDLPSEAEWEKAARGGVRLPVPVQVTTVGQGFSFVAAKWRDNPLPQRAYPWGDEFVSDNANCNANVNAVSTPGCFERGRSLYGCEDLSGNIWEWTRSLWGRDWVEPEFRYPYDSNDVNRERLEADDDVLRVVRGGSWRSSPDLARCAVRYRLHPALRLNFSGFRVVLRSAPVRLR
ncbi:MAG: SUMF1/EgtB/PvdO family nonheme iron enzyme [Candidatus Competibacteraceae bacterium]|nr:SUMF1/EgtB/PvdO family nonheme iron enzyme [Candidatus Competibacteraceae bacterium]